MCRPLAIAFVALCASLAHAGPGADPTRPPHAVPAAIDDASPVAPLAVSSIVYSRDRRVATVGGQVVHEGDTVGSATVVRIERAAVELRGPEGRFTLRLAGAPVKKGASVHGRQAQGR